VLATGDGALIRRIKEPTNERGVPVCDVMDAIMNRTFFLSTFCFLKTKLA
jgi:hypothetical protein